MKSFIPASGLQDALQRLDAAVRSGVPMMPMAGGTDIYPVAASRQAWFQGSPETVLDICGLGELTRIELTANGLSIGACVSWTALAEADLPGSFDALRTAARQVGGRQIQNAGTIGGNLCNASPAADGVPPLLALDAEVELASVAGTRRMPLAAFINGNRRTARQPNELLARIIIPAPPAAERSVFIKLGARRYLVISIASVAANVACGPNGRIVSARIALGACSPVPIRLGRIEAALQGQTALPGPVTLGPADGLAPIDDVRASAGYRSRAAAVLVERAVAACLSPLREAA
jgi:CO/xanthine dehydrogenase FAD-binding subunit